MDNMYKVSSKNGVVVYESSKLGNGVDGLYWKEEGLPPVIILNRKILSYTPYARCVFAEELGHHFSSVGDCIPKTIYRYADRIRIERVEYKAMKWATMYLMPENELLDALRENIYETWELAEHFGVTEEMVKFRLRLFEGKYVFVRNEIGEYSIRRIS